MDSIPIPPSVRSWALKVVLLVVAYKTLGRFLRHAILIPKFTALHDLPNVGKPRTGGKVGRMAIICGGSVAGLLAAAVCATHYESVVIIETDETATGDLPNSRPTRTTTEGVRVPTSSRTRISHYFQFHFFLPMCYTILERLFPNLQTELDRLGVQPIVSRLGLRFGGLYFNDPYPTTDIKSGAPLTLPLSFEAYDILLRNLVNTKGNIQFVSGTVVGFKRSSSGLEGVSVRYQDGSEGDLAGDFIVDATGPTRFGFRKGLPASGIPMPQELQVQYDPHVQYSTSTWKVPSRLHASWPGSTGIQPGLVYYYVPDSSIGENKNFLISSVENSQIQIICGGPGVIERPHAIQEIRNYIKDLCLTPPWLHEMLDILEAHEEECEPYYSDVNTKAMSWVQYDKVDNLPPNFVAVGDAVMKVNPAYGQGVMKGAVDAATLDAVLRKIPGTPSGPLPSISRAFFKKQRPRLSGFWHTTRMMDYGFPTTTPATGDTLENGQLFRKLVKKIVLTAVEDPEVYSVRFHCNMALAPTTDTVAPWLLWRVAKKSLLSSLHF